MYDSFIKEWLGSTGQRGNPINLWVYGSGRAMFLRALRRTRPKAPYVRSSDVSSFHGGNPGRTVPDPATDRKFRRAKVICLELALEDMASHAARWIDAMVNARYAAGKTTVVVSDLDPSTAYDAWLPGVDLHAMPRVVGRILEAGDAIEASEDGVYCSEFVFPERAASDYRIRILRQRVGRVAVLRG